MLLKNLRVVNFRNHKSYDLTLHKGITTIIGENGSGKTSLIEAINIALTGTSWRATDKEILRSGDSNYYIEVVNDKLSGVVVEFDGKKQFEINGKKYGRLPKEYRYPVILFEPRDMNIIYASPSKRRDFFDKAIAQAVDEYKKIMSRYEKVLRQRNELLKGDNVTPEQLFAWDVLLAQYGLGIINRRVEYIEMVNNKIRDVYISIAGKDDKVAVMYDGMVGIDESRYLSILTSGFERDRMTGWTNFGPHRDNFEFLFNDGEAEMKASRGEVRSVVLALKFIEADYIEMRDGEKPIILLDDVFSELDEVRQKKLMKNFVNHQIIITSVEVPVGMEAIRL